MINLIYFGLKVSFIGMGVTFIGLIILIGLVHANRLIAELINKAKRHDEEPVKEAPKPVAKAPAPSDTVAAKSDNGSVIAAITAAVSVMMEGAAFKVTSVKKAAVSQNTNAWDMVAIQEQNNNL